MKTITIVSLYVVCCLIGLIQCQCEVTSQTYTANDGIVITEVAHIITFTAQCDHKKDGLTLYADLNGKTLPAIRGTDTNIYQISWTVELSKSSSGTHSIAIYDEEGFAQLRKAQRGHSGHSGNTGNTGDSGNVKPLFTLNLQHSRPYSGPWIHTELVASVAAVLLWYIAYSAKSKLTS